mmetsp:Transcript_131084/g.407672  ORF Transcript_131084/g.407672 Transcript_131084/m.407672 type:complete len:209 (-) Transcript_131084:661-1287(-)
MPRRPRKRRTAASPATLERAYSGISGRAPPWTAWRASLERALSTASLEMCKARRKRGHSRRAHSRHRTAASRLTRNTASARSASSSGVGVSAAPATTCVKAVPCSEAKRRQSPASVTSPRKTRRRPPHTNGARNVWTSPSQARATSKTTHVAALSASSQWCTKLDSTKPAPPVTSRRDFPGAVGALTASSCNAAAPSPAKGGGECGGG